MCDEVAIIQTGKLIDLRSMETYQAEDATAKVIFEVAQVEHALETLHLLQIGEFSQAGNHHLEAQLSREQIPNVIAALVHAEIQVYSVRTQTKTLEDQFLEMTRSEQIV